MAGILNQDEIDSLLDFDEAAKEDARTMEEILASIRRILADEGPPPKPSLWQRLRRSLFPGRVLQETSVEHMKAIKRALGRVENRLSGGEDGGQGGDTRPAEAAYRVQRELERFGRLVRDADLHDYLRGLREAGQEALFADTLLLAVLALSDDDLGAFALAFPEDMPALFEKLSLPVVVTDEQVAAVADALQDKLDKEYQYDQGSSARAGGVLIRALDREDIRRSVVEGLLVNGRPKDYYAMSILQRLITMDTFARLSDDDLRRFLTNEETALEGDVLAVALKGQSDEVRDRFFACLPEDKGEALKGKMEAMGPVREKDVDFAVTDVVVALKFYIFEADLPWTVLLGLGGEAGE